MILSLQISAFKVTARHKQLSQVLGSGNKARDARDAALWLGGEREGSELHSSLLLAHRSSLLMANLSHVNRAGNHREP